MLSDAAVYQSANHPQKARLVFNTHLHQELKNIAKYREVTTVLIPQPSTVPMHYGARVGGIPTHTMELNGWDLEKKMMALAEVRELLQRPYFLYSDWGGAAAARASGNGGSANGRTAISSYFNKILPLHVGQMALLDLWDYIMDMCDHVPVRNRGRALYITVAVCICRRVEFIEGYELDGDIIHFDPQVAERYYKLLERSVKFCTSKFYRSRFLTDEHRGFMAHVYAVVFFRFPFTSERLLDAILDCTDKVEGTISKADQTTKPASDGDNNGNHNGNNIASLLPNLVVSKAHTVEVHKDNKHSRYKRPSGYRSPRSHRRCWNALHDITCTDDKVDLADNNVIGDSEHEVYSSYSTYISTRGTNILVPSFHNTNGTVSASRSRLGRASRSSEVSLELMFQQAMSKVTAEEEAMFIHNLPLLYTGQITQHQAFEQGWISRDELETSLNLFLDRVKAIKKDELLAITFVAAFMSEVSCWYSHRVRKNPNTNTDAGILWHCIPGYFCMIRLYVSIFRRMCLRRPRLSGASAPTSVGQVLSILSGEIAVDPWMGYWNNREVDAVLDAAADLLKNEALVNVLLKIVLEGTNMLDPNSVNYSFGILQRLLELASNAADNVVTESLVPPANSASGSSNNPRIRRCLGETFDAGYFLGWMRKALQSLHVQTLLKVLTCLYNCIDLLPPTARKRLVGELILRENFFRFFLHWNEEIRKIFCYLMVFKTSASNRLDLPCASDRILLAHSPYFESNNSAGPPPAVSSPTFGYWAHLSEIAQTMLRPNFTRESLDAEKKEAMGANALARLIEWDGSARLKKFRPGGVKKDSIFHDSMVDEGLSVDLSIGSKLDALFKMIADQMNPAHPESHGKYFPIELEAYAERVLSQYVMVLWEYYEVAFETPFATPVAPALEFTIAVPFFTD